MKLEADAGPLTTAPFTDDDYDGPSTSAQAAKRQLSNPRAKFDELSAHDRVVLIHFDEVYTNNTAVYSRTEDVI